MMKPKVMDKSAEDDMSEGQERKRGGAMKKRYRGGSLPKEEEKAAKQAVPQARKRGGMVKGAKSEMRPDRRARGGAMTERQPLSTAGNMSPPDFERHAPLKDTKASGSDKRG